MSSIKDQQPEDRIRFLKRAQIFEALGATHLRIILERGTIESNPRPGCIFFQLSGAGRSGTPTIRNSSGKDFAAMYFDLGRIRYANLGTLKGKEAVYQLFLLPIMVLSEMQQKGMIA